MALLFQFSFGFVRLARLLSFLVFVCDSRWQGGNRMLHCSRGEQCGRSFTSSFFLRPIRSAKDNQSSADLTSESLTMKDSFANDPYLQQIFVDFQPLIDHYAVSSLFDLPCPSPVQSTILKIIFKDSFRTVRRHRFSITKINCLNLFKKTNLCLLWESYETHNYNLWAKYIIVKCWS
jgi:hypothetical protein